MKWSFDDDEFIRLHPDLTVKQLADATGHPWQSCKARRRQLCGSSTTPTMADNQRDEAYMQRQRDMLNEVPR